MRPVSRRGRPQAKAEYHMYLDRMNPSMEVQEKVKQRLKLMTEVRLG
jgi:uncharacterized protein (DUF2236 family)